MASLIGFGSHGSDISTIWTRVRPDNILAIYDDDPNSGVYAPPHDLSGRIVIGVNDPVERRFIAERFGNLRGVHPLADPSAIIGPGVRMGRGSVIAPLACLLRSVTLGCHVHVNYSSSMTRCTVGDFTTVSPGATICGDVIIGHTCLIGAGAVVCDRVLIGNNVKIGAGAIVPPMSIVPDGTTVIGVWRDA